MHYYDKKFFFKPKGEDVQTNIAFFACEKQVGN